MQSKNQNKNYDFSTQEILGKYGEGIIDEWLSTTYKILDVSGIKKYQESGIDRILMRPDGSTVSVEYKFDLASGRTGNLFFETVSIDNQNVPGWGWISQAEFWVFLLPQKEIIVVAPGKLRALVWQFRSIVVEKGVQNVGYKTLGIPIPLEEVRKICHCIKKL